MAAGAAPPSMRHPADNASPLSAGRPKHRRRPSPQRLLAGFLGTTFALLGCVALLRLTEHPWLLPSLGGSCVILFGMARGVMAQPRSFLGGHLLATLVGMVFRAGYVAFVVNNLPRPWGAGPWPRPWPRFGPRFREASPRRRAMADSPHPQGGTPE